MNKKKLFYLRPAIEVVAAAPCVMDNQSQIIHQENLSDSDGDITLEDYWDDEREGRYFTFDW